MRNERVNGWVAGNSFNLAGWTNGTITIKYRSTDNVGNTEIFATKVVRLDARPPRTTIHFVPFHGTIVVNTTTIFTLSAIDDETAVSLSQYNINRTGWTSYTSAFTFGVFSDGKITLFYRSVDAAGNVESNQSIVVYKMESDPIVSIMQFTPVHSPSLVNNQTMFTILVTGIMSKYLTYTWVRINNNAWQIYSGPFSLEGYTSGVYMITYYSQDSYSDIEQARNTTVMLDSTPPRILNIVISSKSIQPGDSVRIRITCDDVHYNATIAFRLSSTPSSISSISQQVFTYETMTNVGNGTYEYTWNTTGLALGNYTIDIHVIDNVSNSVTVYTSIILANVMPGFPAEYIIIVAVIAGFVSVVGIVVITSRKRNKKNRNASFLPLENEERERKAREKQERRTSEDQQRREREEQRQREHDAAVQHYNELVNETRSAIVQCDFAKARSMVEDCRVIAKQARIAGGITTVDTLLHDIDDAEQAEQRRREEQERLDKLRQIIKVSESLEISRLASVLKVDEQYVWDKIFNWAEEFGFKIKENVVIFGQGDTTAFIDELQRQFETWDDATRRKDGKI